MPQPQLNAGLGSIISGNTLTNKTSLSSIIKDVKKSSPNLSKSKRDNLAKTIHKLNTNPNAVVTNSMTKSAVSALAAAGHLKQQYHGNYGSAIAKVRKVHTDGQEIETDDPKKMTYKQRKEWEKKQKIKKARLKSRAKEEREEAEGHMTEGDVHSSLTTEESEHAILEQSHEYKKRQKARASISAMMKEKESKDSGLSDNGNNENDWRDKGELVDMAID